MIGSNQYNLTWKHFCDINTDCRNAFENLCRSLFQRCYFDGDIILHSDPNHPGVEVEPVFCKKENCRISFQAKFFDGPIGTDGYNQIRGSVDQAIKYYLNSIDEIILFCNIDITASSKSYKNIEQTAHEAGIKLVLVTNQSILDMALGYPAVLATYFGLDYLNRDWFCENLQLSLDNLGKRYNSLFNIDTEAQKKLAVFLREANGIDFLNNKKEELRIALNEYRWRETDLFSDVLPSMREKLLLIQDITQTTIGDALEWKNQYIQLCRDEICELNDLLEKEKKEIATLDYKDKKYESLRNQINIIEGLLELPDYLTIDAVMKKCITSRFVVLNGEMGTGKTQLLATAARRLMNAGHLTMLFLGQTFITSDNIEIQMMRGLTKISPEQSLESLLYVLEEYAVQNDKDSVVFIDAINESREYGVWKQGINKLLELFAAFPHIRLVVSLRSGFEKLVLSEKVCSDIDNGCIAKITHLGFADDSPSAIFDFLSLYGIPFSPEYYLQGEMTNPLFLMWFCQTYSGYESDIYTLIDRVLKQADKEASIAIGEREPIGIIESILNDIIKYKEDTQAVITKEVLVSLPSWERYGITNKVAYIRAIERFGLIVSFVRDDTEIYYLGYNLLEDYLRAKYIIKICDTKEQVLEYCKNILLGINENGEITKFGNASVFAMLSFFYVIKYDEECIHVIDNVEDNWDRQRVVEAYYKTFTWRSNHIKLNSFIELLDKYPVSVDIIWNIFIENSTKENCGLNANGLTQFLKDYSINYRDYVWTTWINHLYDDNRFVSLIYYLEQGNDVEGLVEEKKGLLLTLMSWFLTSTNRSLRDRTSKAMIELLKKDIDLCRGLLEKFIEVNDPYIIQRLFGIVFGAIMKKTECSEKEFRGLAQWIVENIFEQENVYPDILLRDYARLIVERYMVEYPDETNRTWHKLICPPYNSVRLPKVDVVDYRSQEYDKPGIRELLYSMKFNMDVKGIGMYGDFGRYTFQASLGAFKSLDIKNVYYYSISFILNELGYTSEYFGEYDSHSYNRGRHDSKKIERIGKKYQWIAMYNILARIADVYKISRWEDKPYYYKGAWDLYVREFDPTLNRRCVCEGVLAIELPRYNDFEFIDTKATDDEINSWVKKESKVFTDFPERFILRDSNGCEWVSLSHYQEVIKKPLNGSASILGFPYGEQHIWSLGTALIGPKYKNNKELLKELKKNNLTSKTCRSIRDCCTLFSREFAWSPGYKDEFNSIEDDDIAFPEFFPAAINFLWEAEYDASQDEATSFYIPSGEIISILNLSVKKYDGFYYSGDDIVAFDLKLIGMQKNELVIRKDYLCSFLDKTNSSLFWNIVGEKQFFKGDRNQIWQRREGYFVFDKNAIMGEIYNVVDH